MAETMGECYEGIVAEIGPQIRKAYGEFINDDELKCMTDEDVASSILDIKITAVEAKCQEDEPICEALMLLASGAVFDTPCCVFLTRDFWRTKNLLDALAEAAIAHRNDKAQRPALPWDYEEALSDECKQFDRGHRPYLYESMVSTLGQTKKAPKNIGEFVNKYVKKNVKKRPWLAGRENLIYEMAEYAWSKCNRTSRG